MEGEQFSLCWNNFHSNLSSGFNSLLKDEDLVDVTLAAGGRFMKAHKTVLSVCSPFFKELFRANPSKHPIVILPDVNYNALCNLLQFMYQGEVSVSQEEIPTFMRVAEMLKVKGLTDNSSSPSSSSESNGFSGSSRSPYNLSDQRQIMKRPRPVKKVIKPMQPLRPLDSPKPPKSPHPPPPKKPHVEESVGPEEQEFPEALIKPKEEPLDDSESNTSQKFDDNNIDLSTMLDAKLGESSKWQSSPDLVKPQDSSTPVPRNTPITGEIRKIIIQRYKSGERQIDISRSLHICNSVVCRIVKKYLLTGEISSKRCPRRFPKGAKHRSGATKLQKFRGVGGRSRIPEDR
jgi:hypothetical protein